MTIQRCNTQFAPQSRLFDWYNLLFRPFEKSGATLYSGVLVFIFFCFPRKVS